PLLSGAHTALHPSPTRRSSDLEEHGARQAIAFLRTPAIGSRPDRRGHHIIKSFGGGGAGGNGKRQHKGSHRDRKRAGHGFDLSLDRKSTRLNSSHVKISYAVFC